MKPNRIFALLSLVVLLLLLYSGTFYWLGKSWISNPYYTHGFLIPLVSGFVFWTKRRELRQATPSKSSAAILALALFAHLAGLMGDLRFLCALSFLMVLGGLILYFCGTKAARAMAFPLCFLILMIPFPFIDNVGTSLQSLSVHQSASLLETMRVPITTEGNEIHTDDASFAIGPACDGVNMLIPLLALAAIFVYVLKGPHYKRTLILIAAIPAAILANTLRIVSIIVVADHHGTELATGFFHDFSSLLFYVVAFLALILISGLLGCRLKNDPAEGSTKEQNA